MLESLTIGNILGIVACLFLIVESIERIIKYYRKPSAEVESKLEVKIDKLQCENRLILKAVSSLILHEVTGDHVNDMEALYEEIRKHVYN